MRAILTMFSPAGPIIAIWKSSPYLISARRRKNELSSPKAHFGVVFA
jgi:hypothetical protein